MRRAWYDKGVVDTGAILKNGRGLLLAYDQGLEHGPTDFNDESVDPGNIVKIAREAGVFTGIIFQKGIAEKYYKDDRMTGISRQSVELPALVVKLNGKTSFHRGEEPYSPQICSADEAISLGAKAVGYTIFVGSEMEARMIKEFSVIEKEAHEKGLPVIGWMYPRGAHVTGKETSKEATAYAARIGLELGCDLVKIHYTGDPESFAWVVKAAGRAGVLAVGGPKTDQAGFLKYARDVMSTGAVGMAVGRNIWQDRDPVGLSRKLGEVIFG